MWDGVCELFVGILTFLSQYFLCWAACGFKKGTGRGKVPVVVLFCEVVTLNFVKSWLNSAKLYIFATTSAMALWLTCNMEFISAWVS